MTPRAGRRSLRPLLLPALVLLAGGALTCAAVYGASRALRSELQAQFSRHADLLEAETLRRLSRAEYGANSLRATWAASGHMGDAELRAYTDGRNMARDFPGIRGFSIVERVRRADLPAFVERARREHPDFRIQDTGTLDDLLVLRSTEPLAANRAALGKDLGAEPLRRAAAQLAIDTGEVWMTPPVRLVQDARGGRGWAFFAPIYRGKPITIADRRQALLALVSVPVVAAEVLGPVQELAGDRLRMALYDGAPDGELVYGHGGADPSALFTADRQLLVGNRLLTLRLQSAPALEAGSSRMIPVAIGAGGALLSLLLALLTWLLAAGRLRALALADSNGADAHRLAAIVEHTAGAVFTTDLAGRFTWVNRSFEAFTGLSQQQLVGMDVDELLGRVGQMDPDKRDAIRSDLAIGRTHRMQLDLPRNGLTVSVEVAVGPQRSPDGRLIGSIGIALDITSQRQAELRVQASEHMLRLITDNIPARISYWDAGLCCLFANQRFREVWGLAADRSILGQPIQALMPRVVLDGMGPHIDQVLRGMPQQFEQVVLEPSGRVSTWQMHLLPDDTDQPTGMFVLGHEISELKSARDQALEASQAKSRFLSSMSHEIRTPMNAVLGMLSLLRSTPLSERQADYAVKAEGAARSLLSLLNDVLDFSKIEAGKMQLDQRPFSLEALLADLSVILSATVGEKDLELLYDLDPRVPDALVGDDMRLRQILINLGGNAVKFTPAGEVVVATRLVARDDATATVEFSVRDTGIGISREQQQRLFTDYSQATGQTARQFGGTGLGLGICRRLTELMGSRLELASEPGRGSRFFFTVTLPTQAAGAAAGTGGKVSVLMVDDNEAARAALCGLAQSLGWHADSVASGEEALARIAAADAGRQAYDAVFVDWRMPGLDGWETSLRIRALPAGSRMPLLVMVTAHGREMLGRRPAHEQALLDGFLVKPVTAAMLREAVDQALAPRNATPQPPPPQEQALAGLRLLVAEDNPVNQQIALELLTARGAVVEVVGDGRLAVDAVARGSHYDAVLMDMRMPEMDGLAATARIRQDLRELRLPIIAMTANAMDSDRDACLAAGMDDHVGKPVEIDEVVRAILRHVRDRRRAPAPAPLAPPAPTPAPDAPAAPMLDRTAAIARLGGNTALFERLLPVFRTNLLKAAGQLQAAVDGGEHEQLCRALHDIKGMAGTLGAMPLARLAGDAEKQLRAGGAVDDPSVRPVADGIAATLLELG